MPPRATTVLLACNTVALAAAAYFGAVWWVQGSAPPCACAFRTVPEKSADAAPPAPLPRAEAPAPTSRGSAALGAEPASTDPALNAAATLPESPGHERPDSQGRDQALQAQAGESPILHPEARDSNPSATTGNPPAPTAPVRVIATIPTNHPGKGSAFLQEEASGHQFWITEANALGGWLPVAFEREQLVLRKADRQLRLPVLRAVEKNPQVPPVKDWAEALDAFADALEGAAAPQTPVSDTGQ